VNRRDFQKLAEVRLKDAQVLLTAHQFDGAYYIGGYAVECALKACICRSTPGHEFPPRETHGTFYIHDLEGLVKVAGIDAYWERDCQADETLAQYWAVVKDWKEDKPLPVER
jgi:hypothetical protein